MEVELRRESEKDYFEAENVIREAFWNHFVPACDEHYILHIMRNSPDFVPELDTVATYKGKIVGCIAYIKSHIISDDGKQIEVLTLGPIGVLPEYQRKGIGGKMIEYTRNIAKNMGFRAIFLYGDPDYYTRNGFISAESKGIRNEENMYHNAMHACELYDGALNGIKGRFIEHSIYKVNEQDAKKFDSNFPKKEIIVGTPSQIKFKMNSNAVKSPE